MKKKITYIILILILSLTGFSKDLIKSEIYLASEQLIQLENTHRMYKITPDEILFYDLQELYYSNEMIAYCVTFANRGFMILPRVSEMPPVLFISYSSSYKNLKNHPFIRSLFSSTYKALQDLGYIESLDSPFKGVTISSKTRESAFLHAKANNEKVWSHLLSNNPGLRINYQTKGVTPLLTTTWSQGYPYNMLTPTVNNQSTVAGCTAIAHAQVLKYWNFPTQGRGSYSYQWEGQTLSANFNHTYNWDLMTDSYDNMSTNQQKQAVARLVLDAGIAVRMNYGVDGSGANVNYQDMMSKFFKYSEKISQVSPAGKTSQQWFDILKAQCDKKEPVLLSMTEKNGTVGHAVVVDGYKVELGENLIHVNMGWGGSADNYYTLDDIYNFVGDTAWIDIHPAEPVFIQTPLDGDICKNTIEITPHINSDNLDNITEVKFYINNILKTSISDNPYTYSWDTNENKNGTATIKVEAYDHNGKYGEDSIKVTVDNIPVTLTGSVKSTGSWTMKRYYVSLEIDFPEKNISEVKNIQIYRKTKGNSDFTLLSSEIIQDFIMKEKTYNDKYLPLNSSHTYLIKLIDYDDLVIGTSNQFDVTIGATQ